MLLPSQSISYFSVELLWLCKSIIVTSQKTKCFKLAYLLILAQSAVLFDWDKCIYLYTLQLYCKLSTDHWYLDII